MHNLSIGGYGRRRDRQPATYPVGRMAGALSALTAAELATHTLRALIERTGLTAIDDVILGNGYANGEAPALGRIAALDAGLGTDVPGLQIDRRCGSGLQAVLCAAGQVATGAASVAAAVRAESMSNVEHYALGLRTGVRQGGIALQDRLDRARETAGGTAHPIAGGMIETAENLRREYGITRQAQDELALRSHQRAIAAHDAGRFAEELIPVTVPGRRGKPDVIVERDEHPRADIDLDTLAALRAVRTTLDPDSTVTAGNASGQNDGAAICVVTTTADAERLGLTPLLRSAGSPHRTGGRGAADHRMCRFGDVFAAAAVRPNPVRRTATGRRECPRGDAGAGPTCRAGGA